MERFRFITAGESHGKGLTAIVEGMVSGLPLQAEYINGELTRRQAGYGRSSRMKIEEDKVEIISGLWRGLTIGSPIALLIYNKDWRDWEAEPVSCPRPGHADLAGVVKYGISDIRPIMERASARETAARVAVGAIGKRFLEELGIAIHSHTVAIGGCHYELRKAISLNWQQVEASPVRCADAELEKEMIAAIDKAKAEGDTLGGIFEVIASGVPVGLGSHVHWDRRLDGRIARAIMSINAVKGVEIGDGFALSGLRGSQAQDIIEASSSSVIASQSSERSEEAAKQSLPWYRPTNHAGGIEGGMSNGEDIVVRAAVKPIATLANPLDSIDLHTGKKAKAHYERSDICVVPAAGVIAEAMLAIVLADACLEKFGGDSLKETLANYRNYLSSLPRF
ncbi:Chorismate synthase [subsurface metagenome]